MVQSDKRKHRRIAHQAPVLYAFQDSDLFFSATMRNYCKNGMCFEAGYAMNPGVEIFVMIEDYSRNFEGHDLLNACHARVRWCKPLPDSDAFFYNIGIKYCQPTDRCSD